MEEERVYKVYMHINLINDKKYIGITKQEVEKRWRNGLGYIGCHRFYNAIQKYGWHNFKHMVLFDRLTKSEAEEIEIELIKYHNTTDENFGYNIQNGGNAIGTHNSLTKIKISNSNKGKKHSEETKVKLSKIAKQRYKNIENHPLFGKKHTKETKQKISLAHKGKKTWNSGLKNCFSKETLDKISKSLTGKKLSEETKKKMSESRKGKLAGDKNPMYGKKSALCKHSKKVFCKETGEIFDNMTEASKKLNISLGLVSLCCNNKVKTAKNFHLMFV